MKITLYKTLDDPKKMNKTLTDPLVMNGVAKDAVDVLHPVIMLEGGISTAGYNIAYIEDYARYYFVKFKPTYNNLIEMSGEVDVLKTFSSYLASKRATITRSENLANAYLQDEQYKAMAYKNIVAKKFPVGLTHDSIILMTVG